MFFLLIVVVLSGCLFNSFYELIWPDNFLQILQKTGFIRITWLLFHLWYLLNLSLQNQKTVVCQVNALGLQFSLDLQCSRVISIQIILWYTWCVDTTTNKELRICKLCRWPVMIVKNLFKVNLNRSWPYVFQRWWVMDKLMKFVEPHPTGVKTEDEQHAFDKIRLSGPIGSHNWGKVLVKRSDFQCTCVWLKVM